MQGPQDRRAGFVEPPGKMICRDKCAKTSKSSILSAVNAKEWVIIGTLIGMLVANCFFRLPSAFINISLLGEERGMGRWPLEIIPSRIIPN